MPLTSDTAIKALTFDTGGTILDWHTGVRNALMRVGDRHGLHPDWSALANDYRRQILQHVSMVARTEAGVIDTEEIHRRALEALIAARSLDAFTPDDRRAIVRAWHDLDVWPDFPPALARLRQRFVVASLTILSVSLVIDAARRNNFAWDAVISCEMIGAYKPRPEVYRRAARWLALEPAQIMMVACHNFDLDAARAVGFKTAFVRRPAEWGPQGSPDPEPHAEVDLKAETFADLAEQLGA